MRFTKSKRNAYWRLMRADKPIGTYLLLWPTWWALLLAAEGLPSLQVALVFTIGVFVMRSAGCVINDYADRKVDGEVKRTAARPIVTGEVSAREALMLFGVLVAVAFCLVFTLNWQTIGLSVGGLALATCYPFMKRYTHLPQVVLGAAFSWGMPMAFMAINQAIPFWAWLLYLANLLWTVAYDTEYAMVDRDDDILIGVKSTAILFGHSDRLVIGALQATTLILLLWLTRYLHMQWPMYVALVVTAGLFGYQQWLIRNRQREACFQAFLHNHYAGMVLTGGIAGHYLLAL